MKCSRVVLPVLALLLATALPARGIRLEMEDYVTYGNLGGDVIAKQQCDGASGGWAVDGVDFMGDWIKLRLSLSDRFCFSDSLRGAGYLSLIRHFAIAFADSATGEVVARDTLVTNPGRGVGCQSANYDSTASSRIFCLPAGKYFITMTRLEGAGYKTRIDWLDLFLQVNPIQPTSWGRIRYLYR